MKNFQDIIQNLREGIDHSWLKFFLKRTRLGKLIYQNDMPWNFFIIYSASWRLTRWLFKILIKDRHCHLHFKERLERFNDPDYIIQFLTKNTAIRPNNQEKTELLKPENRTVIAVSKHMDTSAQAILRLHNNRLLTDAHRALIARHRNPRDLANAISLLNDAQLYSPYHLNVIAGHEDPYHMALLLERLNLYGILTPEICNALIGNQHLSDLIRILEDFNEYEMATPQHFIRAMQHPNPGKLRDILSILKYSNLLNPNNFDLIVTRNDLNVLETLLRMLERRGWLTQNRLTFIIHHQNPQECINAILETPPQVINQIFGIPQPFNPIDVRNEQDLAQDRESSMRALNDLEQMGLESAITKYQPIIEKNGGEATVMKALRDTLKKRYNDKPETIETKDGMIRLPFEWQEFQDLGLSGETKKRALQAYFKNHDHTAYRFLMKPNPWIHPEALFVSHENDTSWANFDPYQSSMALMFLAASDPEIHDIDGITQEHRLNQFIVSLSMIGRAHNWDKPRRIEGSDNMEEYDDLEADKPSCHSGIKKRLMTSVIGHPLFRLLTEEMIHQEIHKFVKNRFNAQISIQNCNELLEAWNAIIDLEVEDKHRETLQQLNISEKQQQLLITELRNVYGQQFNPFENVVKSRLKLSETDKLANHAEIFGGIIELQTLLEEKRKSLKQLSEQKPCFFSGHDETEESLDNQKELGL